MKTSKVDEMELKKWFMNKLSYAERTAIIKSHGATLIDETEKAQKFSFFSKYGDLKLWVPKSAIMTLEEEQKEIKKVVDSFNRYDNIIAKAKALGIKGIRSGMKLATVFAKASEQGFDVKTLKEEN